jgi:hypothetical protein
MPSTYIKFFPKKLRRPVKSLMINELFARQRAHSCLAKMRSLIKSSGPFKIYRNPGRLLSFPQFFHLVFHHSLLHGKRLLAALFLLSWIKKRLDRGLRIRIKLPIGSRAREKLPIGRVFEFRPHWRARPSCRISAYNGLDSCCGIPKNEM